MAHPPPLMPPPLPLTCSLLHSLTPSFTLSTTHTLPHYLSYSLTLSLTKTQKHIHSSSLPPLLPAYQPSCLPPSPSHPKPPSQGRGSAPRFLPSSSLPLCYIDAMLLGPSSSFLSSLIVLHHPLHHRSSHSPLHPPPDPPLPCFSRFRTLPLFLLVLVGVLLLLYLLLFVVLLLFFL